METWEMDINETKAVLIECIKESNAEQILTVLMSIYKDHVITYVTDKDNNVIFNLTKTN